MNGRSIALVLAVFAPMVACGGKATGGSAPGIGTSTPTPVPGDYEPPPPTTDPPPPTTEPPPPTTQPPPVGIGGSSQACVELCNVAATRTCGGVMPTPEEVAACPAECTVAFSEFGPCEDEFAAVLSCMLRSPEFEALFDRICAGEEITDVEAEQLAAICQSQALAFASCIDATPPDTGGGSCTLEDNCAGCDSSCDLCECSSGPGSAECDSLCGRGGETCTLDDDCVGCTTSCDSCNCTLGADDEVCIQICTGEV